MYIDYSAMLFAAVYHMAVQHHATLVFRVHDADNEGMCLVGYIFSKISWICICVQDIKSLVWFY